MSSDLCEKNHVSFEFSSEKTKQSEAAQLEKGCSQSSTKSLITVLSLLGGSCICDNFTVKSLSYTQLSFVFPCFHLDSALKFCDNLICLRVSMALVRTSSESFYFWDRTRSNGTLMQLGLSTTPSINFLFVQKGQEEHELIFYRRFND